MSCISCDQRRSPSSVLDVADNNENKLHYYHGGRSSGSGSTGMATTLDVSLPSAFARNTTKGFLNQQKVVDKNVDQMISESLMKMTVTEREDVYSALHGVSDEIHETSEFLVRCHNQFTSELMKLKVQPPPLVTLPSYAGSLYQPSSAALNLAESIDPTYVNDPKLRLSFLRADCYNPSRAAARMVRYFQWKLEAFGEEKLCKKITLDDLLPKDIKFLKKGLIQRLPVRDRSDREIWCMSTNDLIVPEKDVFNRIAFYLGHVTEESERSGVILLSFHWERCFRSDSYDPELTGLYPRMIQDLPVKICGIHHCVDPETVSIRNMFEIKLIFASKETRAKTRVHFGTYTENLYELNCFGIPTDSLPLTASGKVKTKPFLEWYEMRQCREEFERSMDCPIMYEIPWNRHVLLGRGKPLQKHVGNMRLVNIIDEYVEAYDGIENKLDKTAMAADLVKEIKDKYDTLFLCKDAGVWIAVDDDVAREKVSNLLRARRTLLLSKKNKATTSATTTTTKTSTTMTTARMSATPISKTSSYAYSGGTLGKVVMTPANVMESGRQSDERFKRVRY